MEPKQTQTKKHSHLERCIIWLNSPTIENEGFPPRWKFWNPLTGFFGGIVCGTVTGLVIICYILCRVTFS